MKRNFDQVDTTPSQSGSAKAQKVEADQQLCAQAHPTAAPPTSIVGEKRDGRSRKPDPSGSHSSLNPRAATSSEGARLSVDTADRVHGTGAATVRLKDGKESTGTAREKPENAGKAHQHDGTPGGPLSERAEERNAAEEVRQLGIEGWRAAETALAQWRDQYPSLLQKHREGVDPNIPGWSPSWTQSEFDVAHLLKGSSRIRDVFEAEGMLKETMELAQEAGCPPAVWQEDTFPNDHDDGRGYSISREARVAASAPMDVLNRWFAGQPADRTELAGRDAVPDADHNPAQYWGTHPVENPEDFEPGFDLDREVETWESLSCCAWIQDKALIQTVVRLERPTSIPDFVDGYVEGDVYPGWS